ncbi:ester cyclase [Candidatus Poriferisodalis sp.]|uniref:ester cyclase n=1 Tax=Candidatus Poriferisodalis sp. TaxID=3101277 RepID=UPI003B527BFA
MGQINDTAAAFFDACETGAGWDGCAQYCTDDATFSAQSEAIGDLTDLRSYTEWMKGILTILEDGSYDLKSWAVDEERSSVLAYAVFNGTHTGDGGPVPPTGKAASSDYVYDMRFEGGKIAHITKIWHSGVALQQLGWA